MAEGDLLFAKGLFDSRNGIQQAEAETDVLLVLADLLSQLGGGQGLPFLDGGGQALLVGLALSSIAYIPVATLAFLFYTYPAWVTLVQAVRGAERTTSERPSAVMFVRGLATKGYVPASATLTLSGSTSGGTAMPASTQMARKVHLSVTRA